MRFTLLVVVVARRGSGLDRSDLSTSWNPSPAAAKLNNPRDTSIGRRIRPGMDNGSPTSNSASLLLLSFEPQLKL